MERYICTSATVLVVCSSPSTANRFYGTQVHYFNTSKDGELAIEMPSFLKLVLFKPPPSTWAC